MIYKKKKTDLRQFLAGSFPWMLFPDKFPLYYFLASFSAARLRRLAIKYKFIVKKYMCSLAIKSYYKPTQFIRFTPTPTTPLFNENQRY